MTEATADCGFTTAVRVIGGKWKVDILCELSVAPRRFGRLRRAIPAISEKMLTQQLREMEADGVIARKADPGPPAKVVYSLTAHGAALNDGVAALCRWGEGHRRPEASPAAVADRPADALPARA